MKQLPKTLRVTHIATTPDGHVSLRLADGSRVTIIRDGGGRHSCAQHHAGSSYDDGAHVSPDVHAVAVVEIPRGASIVF